MVQLLWKTVAVSPKSNAELPCAPAAGYREWKARIAEVRHTRVHGGTDTGQRSGQHKCCPSADRPHRVLLRVRKEGILSRHTAHEA